MTAIALTHTDAGFVLAADGRMRLLDRTLRSSLGHMEGQHRRKIFQDVFVDISFAWAVSGPVYSDDRKYNLIQEVRRAIQSAKDAPMPRRYHTGRIAIIASSLHASSSDMRKVIFVKCPPTFATVFIAGYLGYGHTPVIAFLDFSHQNGTLLEPEQSIRDPRIRPSGILAGSEEIRRRYSGEQEDGRFRKYFHPSGQTLADGLAHTKGFIEACCDPLAATVDPDIADRIGGHIHAAVVTPNRGFEWIAGYEPIESMP
jgi:hypothetical protein